ncbi:hypothetical protein OPV22_014060 [Ensete ventricosum]|uniref:Uncharacterized protein n=1 Tax=Ensete ventricosum TaxID=4639 RepID=A0AAV8PJ44_ENSVE|nr:hypothetical protein OPV22_014060 [Ensete ventricosum]
MGGEGWQQWQCRAAGVGASNSSGRAAKEGMAGSDERQIGWKSREEEGEMKSSRKKRQQGRGSDGRGGRGDGQRLRRVRKAVVASG